MYGQRIALMIFISLFLQFRFQNKKQSAFDTKSTPVWGQQGQGTTP
jgi:hypothetical protein